MSERSSVAGIGDGGGDVLIVDDFPDALALYEAVLTEDGHRVRIAQNGVEALRHVYDAGPLADEILGTTTSR